MRRIIVSLYLVVFVGLLVMSGAFYVQARDEHAHLKDLEAKSKQRLAELEAKLADQQKVLDRLKNDPEFVERVIRKQLKYARPDETVFRFSSQ